MIQKVSTLKCIDLTASFIKNYYSHNIEKCYQLLDDEFTWLGTYNFQNARNKKEFINIINNKLESEHSKPEITVSHDKYSPISNNSNLCVIEGCFFTSTHDEMNHFLLAKTRCTFIWKKVKKNWFLLHLHMSHVRDIPLIYDSTFKKQSNIAKYDSWFQYFREIDKYETKNKRTIFKDTDGTVHYVLAAEIIYVEVNDKLCIIHTFGDSIIVRSSLQEIAKQNHFLLLVHKKYLVNRYYIKSIKRYELELINDTIIPVSQKNYLQIKNTINNNI